MIIRYIAVLLAAATAAACGGGTVTLPNRAPGAAPGSGGTPPAAGALVTSTEVGTTLQIDLAGLASDPGGGRLTFALPQATGSLGGMLSLVPERLTREVRILQYTPAAGTAAGMTETFTYTATNGAGLSAGNTISVTLQAKVAGQLDFQLYQAKVDPVLAANCIGCHEAPNGGGNLQLAFAPLLGSAQMRMNYDTVRGFADLNDPAGSPLLQKATGNNHGGGMVLTAADQEYADILGWIQAPVP